jgi:hypothetical protein
MPAIDLSILNQRQTPAFYADVFANRPAAGFVGRIFVSTDTYAFYRDNGTGWDLIGGPGTGTITGAGASGQIALWSGASTIVGDTGLTYDGTANSLTASQFIVTGGTSSQFLKGDGSLDSSAYITASALSAYVPYTGATTDVNLGAFNLTADVITGATGSFTSSGGSNTFGITHSSGSGIALNISKDGNGEGLFVTKGSGSGNAAKIVGGKSVFENSGSDSHIQIVGATAPSLRIDNLETGATKRIGLGISTAVNNFIQGSTGGEYCIFNSSTTASPILFGIYDAGLTNTQEAARISAARNFLIGTTTDAGYKLDVNGNSRILASTYTQGAILYLRDASATGSNTTFAGLFLGSSPGVDFVVGKQSTNTVGSFAIKTGGGTSLFTLSDTGAATFSSTVEATRYLVNTGTADQTMAMGYWDGANARIESGATYPMFITSYNGVIKFGPNGSEAMRLSNAQNLLIGTTTDNGNKLQVNGTSTLNKVNSSEDSFTNISNGATSTIFTLAASQMFLFYVTQGATNQQVTFTASVAEGGTTAIIGIISTTGATLSITASGLNVQATNTSGVTITAKTTCIRIK